MSINNIRRRNRKTHQLSNIQESIQLAYEYVKQGLFNDAFDICEELLYIFPQYSVSVLTHVFDWYQLMPDKNRYHLYQSRYFDFGIKSGDRVLDIGSGHKPFPFATHLADFATEDDSYGRAGAPMKILEGREVYQCNVEDMPFEDKQFDFVHCSHVLEHTENPERACKELMRVAKRGYIETPNRSKDLWLNSAGISNHRWAVETRRNVLTFEEYTAEEIKGIGSSILLSMHCAPESDREKAFAAMVWLKSDLVNTMFMWDESFDYRIEWNSGKVISSLDSSVSTKTVVKLSPEEIGAPSDIDFDVQKYVDKNDIVDSVSEVESVSSKYGIKAPDKHEIFDSLKPHAFAIETVLGCNLRCPECAVGSGLVTRKHGMLSFDDYKIIAEKIKPYAKRLYLHLWGEPMLNKDIIPMIKDASQFSRVNISTNALTLTPQLSEELITSGVKDLIVSIDGMTQDVYEKYRVGGDSLDALSALKVLSDLNKKYGNNVHIMPQFIVFDHNEDEMGLFKQYCETLGIAPVFKAPYIRSDSKFKLSSLPDYSRPYFDDVESLKSAMKGCEAPQHDFVILLDGSVVGCCHDYDGQVVMGNIFESDVMDIWNGEKSRNFRYSVLSGNAPDFCVKNCMSYFLK